MIRAWRTSLVIGLLTLTLLSVGGDVLQLNPAKRVSLRQQFSLVRWEASNLPDKWMHRLLLAVKRDRRTESDRRDQVHEYFRLGARLNELRHQMSEVIAKGEPEGSTDLAALDAGIERVQTARGSMRDEVEETIEATIALVLNAEGIKSWGPITFPPVDIRFGQAPKALIVSPRHRIAQLYAVLLRPRVSPAQSEVMERTLREGWDLSAIVVPAGGVATYPPSIEDTVSLSQALRTAGHEWMHNYLVFLPPDRPLGRKIFASSEMHTLNETFADVVGSEIAELALQKLGGVPPSTSPARPRPASAEDVPDRDFDFDGEMRETRQHVDELLRTGSVEEAEDYMERRRRFFVENGAYIRKLNQAYFAFHGNYALLPQSSSPIGPQMIELRGLVPNLKTFVDAVSRVSSYERFLQTLSRLRAQQDSK